MIGFYFWLLEVEYQITYAVGKQSHKYWIFLQNLAFFCNQFATKEEMH